MPDGLRFISGSYDDTACIVYTGSQTEEAVAPNYLTPPPPSAHSALMSGRPFYPLGWYRRRSAGRTRGASRTPRRRRSTVPLGWRCGARGRRGRRGGARRAPSGGVVLHRLLVLGAAVGERAHLRRRHHVRLAAVGRAPPSAPPRAAAPSARGRRAPTGGSSPPGRRGWARARTAAAASAASRRPPPRPEEARRRRRRPRGATPLSTRAQPRRRRLPRAPQRGRRGPLDAASRSGQQPPSAAAADASSSGSAARHAASTSAGSSRGRSARGTRAPARAPREAHLELVVGERGDGDGGG